MITAVYKIKSLVREVNKTFEGESIKEICFQMAIQIRKDGLDPDECVSITMAKESIKSFQVPFVQQKLKRYLGGRFRVLNNADYTLTVTIFRR